MISSIVRAASPIEEVQTNSLTLENLKQYYHLPIKEAAKQIGSCVSAIKHACRKQGLSRWPYRIISSINENMERLKQAQKEESDPNRLERLHAIEIKLKEVESNIEKGNYLQIQSTVGLANLKVLFDYKCNRQKGSSKTQPPKKSSKKQTSSKKKRSVKQKTAEKENEAPQSNHATFSTPAPLQDKTSGLTTRKMPNIYDPKYDRSTKSETPTPVQKMPNIYDF